MSKPWLINIKSSPQATCRLVCFAYAGGGASIFRRWSRVMPEHIELMAIQLPGREERTDEAFITDYKVIVNQALSAIKLKLDKPLVLFGYSMGGRIAYEVANELAKSGYQAKHIILGATRAPNVERENPIYQLADTQFLQAVNKNNGIPQAILNEPELMAMLLPRLRADYTVLDTLPVMTSDASALTCPLTILGGTRDNLVTEAHSKPWQDYTQGPFIYKQLEGDHFFINKQQETLLNLINQASF